MDPYPDYQVAQKQTVVHHYEEASLILGDQEASSLVHLKDMRTGEFPCQVGVEHNHQEDVYH